MQSTAAVTAVLPAFNVSGFISEALDSVRAQTYAVRETIVVDDASTDETVAVLGAYQAAHPDFAMRIEGFPENQGVSAARNRGIQLASTPYIAFLDPDDLWMPKHVEMLTEPLLNGADFAYAWLEEFGADELFVQGVIRPSWWERLTWPKGLFRRNYIFPSALAARKSALERVGAFPETCRVGEDWAMMVRAIKMGMTVREVPSVGCRMRKHYASVTADKVQSSLALWSDSEPLLEEYPELLKIRRAEGFRVNGYWHAHRDTSFALREYVAAIRNDPTRLNLWVRVGMLLLMLARLEFLIPTPLKFQRDEPS